MCDWHTLVLYQTRNRSSIICFQWLWFESKLCYDAFTIIENDGKIYSEYHTNLGRNFVLGTCRGFFCSIPWTSYVRLQDVALLTETLNETLWFYHCSWCLLFPSFGRYQGCKLHTRKIYAKMRKRIVIDCK